MKKIFHETKYELLYQVFAKSILIAFTILLLLAILNLISLSSKITDNYARYLKTRENYEQDGIDIESSLRAPNTVKKEDGFIIVDNPLKYDYMELSNNVHNLNPKYVISNTLEYMIFVFCTFTFAIYGAYIAAYDYKYKMYKTKTNRKELAYTIISKLLSMLLAIFLVVMLTSFMAYILSFFFNEKLKDSVPLDDFFFEDFGYKSNMLIQIFFSIIVTFIYGMWGFLIGFLCKNISIPTIVFAMYGFVVPILGKYDLRNIISNLSHEIFDFKGRFQMFEPIKVNNFLCIMYLVLYTLIPIFISVFIGKRRSLYP